MTLNPMDELLARVERLEKQNRRLKLLGFAVAVVVGTGVLMAAAADDKPQKKTVEANRISFRDDDGNERGFMVATPEGLGLVFTAGGGARSGLVVNRDGVLLQYLDNQGRPLTGLSVQDSGVCVGFRSQNVGTNAGSNAIRDVIGSSLNPNPLLGKSDSRN